MAVSFEVVATDHRVHFRYGGVVDVSEWERAFAGMFADRSYSPGFDIVVDGTDAPPPHSPCLRRVVTFLRAHSAQLGGGRWAIAVADQAAYGMMRMAQGLAGDDLPAMGIFATVSDCEDWLRRDSREKLG